MNKKYKVLIKGAEKKVLATKDKESADKEYRKIVQVLDRAANKGIMHKNKAANKKSKLAKFVNKVK